MPRTKGINAMPESKDSTNNKTEFNWGLVPDAEILLQDEITMFLASNAYAASFAKEMIKVTSTRFIDWIDHIVVPNSRVGHEELLEIGFSPSDERDTDIDSRVYEHSGTFLFPVIVSDQEKTEVSLKPENIVDFVQMSGENLRIEGGSYSQFRKAEVSSSNNTLFSVVERRGYDGFRVSKTQDDVHQYVDTLEAFRTRQRNFASEEEGLAETLQLIKHHAKQLSKERVADAFFRAERNYWEKQNKAGQIQRARQDRLGLGWGNHDHHTYRSSRRNFRLLNEILENLGFKPREQFFAGANAGWGAQVLEHPVCDFVVFADMDVTEEEHGVNFAHLKLEDKDVPGTVGLWTALHGESILEAGLHHLAVRVDFDKVRTDLDKFNIGTLRPFSSFDFLWQAFTEVERKNVEIKRVIDAFSKRLISEVQRDTFMKTGAIHSHLEIIQRGQGFKGFNQDSVSVIIQATDPRRQVEKAA
ncbi:MAG: hypothetical protein ACXADL_14640 [Candidatus Thorarchaeota archaeon]|jgi:hypothetical protein